MRHDFEYGATQTVAAYIEAEKDPDFLAGVPVAQFYDPMTTDDQTRIIVTATDGETKLSDPGSAIVMVEVGLLSLVPSPSASTAIATHFQRVNALRDLFNVAAADDAVNAHAVDGIQVNRIESVRRFSTRPPATDSGFILSTLELQMHVNTKVEA